MSYRLGTITIGQSPRKDVMPEMLPFLGKGIEVIEAGALDGLDYDEILKMAPEPGDYVLVSTLRDGRGVKFAERHILSLLQNCIEGLEKKGVQAILFICTGKFPDVFHASVPLIYPQEVLHRIVPELTGTKKIGVFIPDRDQVLQTGEKWKESGLETTVIPWSPYLIEKHEVPDIGDFTHSSIDLIVMDCIGYTQHMKELITHKTGKPVILPRTLLARILGELGQP